MYIYIITILYISASCLADQNLNYTGRIIGGTDAENAQFPWYVSIIGRLDEGNNILCGGSLISNKWVLTSAICVKGYVFFLKYFFEVM